MTETICSLVLLHLVNQLPPTFTNTGSFIRIISSHYYYNFLPYQTANRIAAKEGI